MLKINPVWVAYQNTVNEGGEGFNPHPKYIPAQGGANLKKYMLSGQPMTGEALEKMLAHSQRTIMTHGLNTCAGAVHASRIGRINTLLGK